MTKTAERASKFIRSEFVVQSSLLGWPGTTKRFAILIVPPRDEEVISPAPDSAGTEDFSANRRKSTAD
jgi:hypothetical protein